MNFIEKQREAPQWLLALFVLCIFIILLFFVFEFLQILRNKIL